MAELQCQACKDRTTHRHTLAEVPQGERVHIWHHGVPLEVVRTERGTLVVDEHGGDLRGHYIRRTPRRMMLVQDAPPFVEVDQEWLPGDVVPYHISRSVRVF